MEKNDANALSYLLEKAGYEYPEKLIEEVLIPLAIRKGWSLCKAIHKYADAYLRENTDWQPFHIALTHVNYSILMSLNIHDIIKKPLWI